MSSSMRVTNVRNKADIRLASVYQVRPSWLSCTEWNLSIEGTTETQLAVLYREVSLVQR